MRRSLNLGSVIALLPLLLVACSDKTTEEAYRVRKAEYQILYQNELEAEKVREQELKRAEAERAQREAVIAERERIQREQQEKREAEELTRFCRNRNTPLDAPLPQKLYAGQCYLAQNTVAISARLGANGQPQYVYERQLEAMLRRIRNSNVQRFALRAAVAAYQSPERANGDLACKWTLRTCLQLVE